MEGSVPLPSYHHGICFIAPCYHAAKPTLLIAVQQEGETKATAHVKHRRLALENVDYMQGSFILTIKHLFPSMQTLNPNPLTTALGAVS